MDLSATGIGIASAGFPAKLTATVFCVVKTRASKRAIFPMDGILGGRILKRGQSDEINLFEDLTESSAPIVPAD